jgi:hypothetical protein
MWGTGQDVALRSPPFSARGSPSQSRLIMRQLGRSIRRLQSAVPYKFLLKHPLFPVKRAVLP